MRHRNLHGRSWLAIGTLVFLLLGPGVDAKGKLLSTWLDRDITIDGELDEWRDALVYFGSVDAFVGVFNDDSHLYLCLYSQSPELSSQFATDGLRLKIEGKKSDRFVVHFPRAEQRTVPAARGRQDDRDRPPASTDTIGLEIPGQRDLVVVSAGGDAGLEARLSHRGSFVYELKIPLAAGAEQPWAPGLFPGDKFKLLIENPRSEELADERAMQDAHRGSPSAFEPSTAGPYGTRSNGGWTGPIDDDFFVERFVFLLKTRVELAKSP
ncbi:MAG: hypothetical protein GTN89_00875 [Acidobacteria bacterium]|nr:hypothetical protein [Acidobacteriota bacterium]NIM60731.1 hypothetical protein [Acidobacteriota bacterium]NIO57944.1 hypothetical protein [Acidobacteriota bacterium]NIQ28949.1 hypothetical protein [Acidobacteriota bacterium]NIQ83421.1 hypothetical protein [Acidobacteriota bacterium]